MKIGSSVLVPFVLLSLMVLSGVFYHKRLCLALRYHC
jgi:hypothetical protein